MAGVLVSWNVTYRPKDFFVWLMLLVAGVYGVFLSTDLFFLFFFYELAVVPMYLLIGVWGSSTDFRAQDPVEGRGFGGGGKYNRPKEYGAMKLMLYLVAGSVLVWVAIHRGVGLCALRDGRGHLLHRRPRQRGIL